MPSYLITGANRGIGLELCKQLHQRGDFVIATCRNTSPELISLGVRIEQNIDISSEESILSFLVCLWFFERSAQRYFRISQDEQSKQ